MLRCAKLGGLVGNMLDFGCAVVLHCSCDFVSSVVELLGAIFAFVVSEGGVLPDLQARGRWCFPDSSVVGFPTPQTRQM